MHYNVCGGAALLIRDKLAIAIDCLVPWDVVNQSAVLVCRDLAPSCAWRAIAKTGVGSAILAMGAMTPSQRKL
ncbi:hypothetical protein GN244_ATG06809 [Phytophthora infestans]|uniref:Uncharacterized protein n=1 Tax=Phytophthora infestans TaxID=4787 RepID=A0A833SWZ4_PHYIN|nr:hypothetical protein GN244_ATG06809 [Phytophthora infestans]KAF4136422.1 hypothetical protein GN958_ATG14402 [Phytophthora infestans]